MNERVVKVEIGDIPIFTRIQVGGVAIPVLSAVVESIVRDDESVLVLRIPMWAVDLEGM